MKDGIVWSGKNKKTGELYLERNVLPADPDAELFKNEEEKLWQIKATKILSSKPVVVEKK